MEPLCSFIALTLVNFCDGFSLEPVVFSGIDRDENMGVFSSYFEKHEMHALSLPSMKNLTTMKETSLDCGFTCTRLKWCVSYNFQRNSNQDGQHRCEILSSDKYNNSNDFWPNEEFDHFSIMSPCSKSPCQNGGTCIALYENNDFVCSCTGDFVGSLCEVEFPSSCKEIYEHLGGREDKAYLLKMGDVKKSIFCHMTDILNCGGGGWTLIMKLDGSKSTFSYDSSYWSKKNTYNLPGGATGLDNQETKLPSYWNTPFTKLCLGMKVGADTRFILLHRQATSLYSLIADGQYRATSLGRDTWKSLIAGSSLQTNCGMEGFNNRPPNSPCKSRIGIAGNQENNCLSSDSFIGFGSMLPSYYTGNRARWYSDNGDKLITAFGYILVH